MKIIYSSGIKLYAKIRTFIQNVDDFNVSDFTSILKMLKYKKKGLKLLTLKMTDFHTKFIPYFTHLGLEFPQKLKTLLTC